MVHLTTWPGVANSNSLFKAAPASAVTMWTYERMLQMLINKEEADNTIEK